MNPDSTPKTPIPTVPLARIAEPHGYRFDGDQVHLHAGFTVLDRAADQCTWTLQLWACPSAPTSARDLCGHLVAEVPLPRLGTLLDGDPGMREGAFASPPPGNAEHVMALVLAAGRPGHIEGLHDVVTYSCHERFIQPSLGGTTGYRIDGDSIHLTVDRIENPRDTANRSGTLTLELWALDGPYSGGFIPGVHLAGVVLGPLAGQTILEANAFDLRYTPPPPGEWEFVLMLREWTASGYITRDFRSFPAAVVITRPAAQATQDLGAAPAVPSPAAPTAPAPGPTAPGGTAAVAALPPGPIAKTPTPAVPVEEEAPASAPKVKGAPKSVKKAAAADKPAAQPKAPAAAKAPKEPKAKKPAKDPAAPKKRPTKSS